MCELTALVLVLLSLLEMIRVSHFVLCLLTQETTHLELKQSSMLSAIASLTPFSDFNQSPRNMYQCQVNRLLYLNEDDRHATTASHRLLKSRESSRASPANLRLYANPEEI